jgi:nicotinate phosphoribosyltransferase
MTSDRRDPPARSALLLDLYQLTMAQSYFDEGMEGLATFSLFVRHLPTDRGYLVAAGLEDVLDYLESFAFVPDELDYLRSTGLFSDRLLEQLRTLHFSGAVRALPEGTIFFPDEPILEVTAPIIEAQLVETVIINEIQLQTMIASKAARCVTVAGGRRLVDFALRRTQGPETGLKVARASYLAGFDATSNVLAGQRYGIPVAGTMAHSYVQAFGEEIDAFRAYARAYPEAAVLLLDTYDTTEGARRAAVVGQELAERGHRLRGVRLDSGDFVVLSRAVRTILDEAGLRDTIVFASGNLDEYAVERLMAAGAPIDGFGVGTRMGVSADAPYLELAYKLVSYAGRATLKLSADKATRPGPKQIWRSYAPSGDIVQADWLALADEPGPGEGKPLLVEVMQGGRRTTAPDPLDRIREHSLANLAALPPGTRSLRDPDSFPVYLSPALQTLERELVARVAEATRRS